MQARDARDDLGELPLDQVADFVLVAFLAVGVLEDALRRLDDRPPVRLGPHDLGVTRAVGRGGHGLHAGMQVRGAAHAGQLAAPLQLVGHGDGVHGLARRVQAADRAVNRRVRGPVVLLSDDARLQDLAEEPVRRGVPGAREDQRPDHRLLGIEILRRHPGERGQLPASGVTAGGVVLLGRDGAGHWRSPVRSRVQGKTRAAPMPGSGPHRVCQTGTAIAQSRQPLR